MRKVLTTLVPEAVPGNKFKSPESDSAVYYNSNGLLELNKPLIRCPVNEIVCPDEDTAKRNSHEAILTGMYFVSNINPMHPSLISPYRYMLIRSATGPAAWTLPDNVSLISYMREAFPGILVSGISWSFRIMSLLGTLTINAPANSSVSGFNSTFSHIISPGQSIELVIIIEDITGPVRTRYFIF